MRIVGTSITTQTNLGAQKVAIPTVANDNRATHVLLQSDGPFTLFSPGQNSDVISTSRTAPVNPFVAADTIGLVVFCGGSTHIHFVGGGGRFTVTPVEI